MGGGRRMSVAELKERHVAATETVNTLKERLKQRRRSLLDTDGVPKFLCSFFYIIFAIVFFFFWCFLDLVGFCVLFLQLPGTLGRRIGLRSVSDQRIWYAVEHFRVIQARYT